jgi:hypothetical protein
MTSKQLEVELKKLDPSFSVVDNPSRPGLSNIFYKSTNYDLPVVSTTDIRDAIEHGHRYEFPNGMSIRHHSKGEIMARITDFLTQVNSPEFRELYG